MASNICTAFRPSDRARLGAPQKRRTRSRSASRVAHVRGQHVGEAADLAPAHGVGLAGERERPRARLADAPGGQVAIDDGVDLVGALRRLVHALRVAADDALASPSTSDRTSRRPRLASPVARATAGDAAALGARRRERRGESLRVIVDEARSIAPRSASQTSRPFQSCASVPGLIDRCRSAPSLVAVRRGSMLTTRTPRSAARHLDALVQHRMAPGRVGADQHHEVGELQVLVALRHDVGAERAAMPGHRRGHAQPRVGVDVRRADEALRQLVGDVVVLGQQLPGQIERDRLRPVRVR